MSEGRRRAAAAAQGWQRHGEPAALGSRCSIDSRLQASSGVRRSIVAAEPCRVAPQGAEPLGQPHSLTICAWMMQGRSHDVASYSGSGDQAGTGDIKSSDHSRLLEHSFVSTHPAISTVCCCIYSTASASLAGELESYI